MQWKQFHDIWFWGKKWKFRTANSLDDWKGPLAKDSPRDHPLREDVLILCHHPIH